MSSNFVRLHGIINKAYAENFSFLSHWEPKKCHMWASISGKVVPLCVNGILVESSQILLCGAVLRASTTASNKQNSDRTEAEWKRNRSRTDAKQKTSTHLCEWDFCRISLNPFPWTCPLDHLAWHPQQHEIEQNRSRKKQNRTG